MDMGRRREKCLQELKEKLAKESCLGVPNSEGEIVLVTDASDIGGGAMLFQWQKIQREQIPKSENTHQTKGVNSDGTISHSYPDTYTLVPLGHFNWKWNDARKNYFTYEQELVAGVLAISTQFRIL